MSAILLSYALRPLDGGDDASVVQDAAPLRAQVSGTPQHQHRDPKQHHHHDPKSDDPQFGWQVHDQTLDGKTGRSQPQKMRRPGEQSRAFAAFKRATKKRSCRGGGPLKAASRKMANRSGDAQWGILPSGCISRRAAMQNSWIWGLLLALALCAALAFFLIEVWQLVEFTYR